VAQNIKTSKNFCGASELKPPFRHNIFQHIYFQPIVKQIFVIIFTKIYVYIYWLHDYKLLTQMYRRILSYRDTHIKENNNNNKNYNWKAALLIDMRQNETV